MKGKKIFVLFNLILMISLNLKAQDWANLNFYKSENKKVTASERGEKRVVFFGNSITEQWKKNSLEFFDKNPYLCRGISGQTTPQMLVRFRQDVVDLSPIVVVILAGTNDIAGNTGETSLKEILDNLKSMAELAESNNIKVVLCSVLPVDKYPWSPKIKPSEKIVELNKMIKAYCEESNHIYLNYFSAMATESNAMITEYTTDGVHVTKAGYVLMEQMVQAVLEKI